MKAVAVSILATTIFRRAGLAAEAIRKLGDQYNRTRLTPVVKKVFRKWLAWGR